MKKRVLLIVIACILVIVAGFIVYLNSDGYKFISTHFAKGTEINGVDCSQMTKDEAKSVLTSKWNDNVYVFNKNDKELGKIKLNDYSYDIENQLEDIIKSNVFSPIINTVIKKDRSYNVKMNIVEEAKLEKAINKLKFLNNKYKVKTKNAYVDMTNHKFKIKKEVYGDNVDKTKVKAKVKKDIAKGNFTLKYDKADYYELPTIKSDNPDLKEEQDFDKKNYSQKITYKVYSGDYVIQPKYLARMMPKDGNGGTTLDEKAVEKFVSKVLAWDINTAYAPRKFKDASGSIITVEGGNYGYTVNKKKEVKKLTEELKAGKDVTRKPIYSQQPYYKGEGMNDIGNSYIEINISAQELWLFKKGKVKLNTSVVTGKAGAHDTPTGVYEIEYLQRNTVLRGNNDDGSQYNSDVSYWMPFNGGIGCHDASWRGAFGGGIYLSDGSHGCVNMPTDAAGALYYSIEKGFPVVVHY